MSEETKVNKHPGYKRWVFVFLILALGVHAGVFFVFTLDLDEPVAREKSQGFLVYQPEGFPLESDELEQRAYLFDSEPIFLPTTRNYSGPIKTDASKWEPEVKLSAPFPPDIQWDDSLLMIEPGLDGGSGTPMELLKPISRDFVSEFAADRRSLPEIGSPGLFVEAKSSWGVPVLKTFIELEDGQRVDFPQNPAEFSISLTHFGLAGKPLLILPSGSEETDNFVREFIIEQVHPLLVGTTGYIHIRIGR